MRALCLALLITACGEDPPPPSQPPPPVESVEAVAPPAGCPTQGEGVQLADDALTVTAPIGFDLYAGTIAPESLHAVDAVARRLIACADLEVEIQVHTDSMRLGAFNARQSQVIASALRDRLIEQGADGARLAACGYGESRPIAPNTTAEGRATNTRVEWRRIDDAAAHACPPVE